MAKFMFESQVLVHVAVEAETLEEAEAVFFSESFGESLKRPHEFFDTGSTWKFVYTEDA